MQIREATAGDAASIAALWTEAYVGPGPGERHIPYGVEEAEEALAAAPVFVAEEAGAILGVVVLYPPAASGRVVGGEGEAELSRLAVARRARRDGIGWALTSHCIDFALEAEHEAIVLWSRPHQTAAHQLYEEIGFVRQPARDSADASGPRRVYRIDLRVPH